MIFTRSWLSDFIDIADISDEKILSTLNHIGFEVESYKKITVPQGVVVGKVLECEKHPNADKLNVCQVDNGISIVTIVCGATNVAKDQMVAVATLGTVLPSGLLIKQAELRGIQSFGMLCSSDELGIEKINEGILVFDSSVDGLKIGVELNTIIQIADSIFEIDITPNRSDCLSIHGIARELSSVFGLEIKKIIQQAHKDVEKGVGRVASMHSKGKTDASISIKIAEKIDGIGELNLFLIDYRLAIIGIKPKEYVAKIVDYAMHATGVLLNVFSGDSFLLNQDSKYEIFIEKNSDGIDVVRSKDELYQIGITQKEESRASKEDEVLLFCASYLEPTMLQELGSKIVKKDDQLWQRSSKGSEINLLLGLEYIEKLVTKYCQRQFYSGVVDDSKTVEQLPIKVDINKINLIIGEELDKNQIVGILSKLGFEVTVNAEFNSCVVKAPPFRHDIVNVHDLAEEILRIKGIDALVAKPLLIKEEKRSNDSSKKYYQLRTIRQKAVSKGFFETVHFIFADKKDVERFGFEKLKEALELANPITAELNTLRSTLLLNMLSSASKNFKNSSKMVPIFESGTVFDKNRKESSRIAFVWSGKANRESIANTGKPSDIEFVDFITKISDILGGITVVQGEVRGDFFHPFRYFTIIQNGHAVGFASGLHRKAEEHFGLPTTFVCEVELDKLEFPKKEAAEFSRFQKSERDLTLLVPDDLKFEYIKKCIEDLDETLIKDFFVVDSYKATDTQKESALSIRFILQSSERTLDDTDISGVISKVLDKLLHEFGIGIKQ